MSIKTSNNISVRLSEGALIALQHIGYLNKLKRVVKGTNLSEFISKSITKEVGLQYPATDKEIKEGILRFKLLALQEKRDKFSDEITFLENKMNEVHNQLKEVKN